MGKLNRDVYSPHPAAPDAYDTLYAECTLLHDYFGRGTTTSVVARMT
jgi:L-ribulokinase